MYYTFFILKLSRKTSRVFLRSVINYSMSEFEDFANDALENLRRERNKFIAPKVTETYIQPDEKDSDPTTDRHLLFAPRHDFFSLDAGALKKSRSFPQPSNTSPLKRQYSKQAALPVGWGTTVPQTPPLGRTLGCCLELGRCANTAPFCFRYTPTKTKNN